LKNKYEIRGEITAIFLNKKDGTILETLINTSDLEKAMELPISWFARWDARGKTFYVSGTPFINGKRTTINFHRWILDAPKGMVVDHINHDTLNNTRTNLRIVTSQQNCQNRNGAFSNSKSGIRGVSFHKKTNKWRATIKDCGKYIHLGVFDNVKEAEKASIEARKKYMPYAN
jgi:hypothetical protein